MSIVPSLHFFALDHAHGFPFQPCPPQTTMTPSPALCQRACASTSTPAPDSRTSTAHPIPRFPSRLSLPQEFPSAPAAAADRLPSSSSSSLLGLAGAAVHQTAIQTHPQRPIYSDPVFHASRSSSLSRIINHSAPHLASEEQYVRRHSWREGEAGPSTFGYPSGTQRNTGAWQIQPKDEALPTVIPREEFSYPSSWPEADPPPTSYSYHHAPSQRRDRIDWGSRDPPNAFKPRCSAVRATTDEPAAGYTPSQLGIPHARRGAYIVHHGPIHSSTSCVSISCWSIVLANCSPDMSSTGLYSPQYYSSAPNETSIHEHLRYLPSSSSSMLDNYTLPPPPSDSPSPSTSALRSRLLSPIMLAVISFRCAEPKCE
ncbi:hypothetical protein DFP72DRAFT_302798 [Ephemerocybe angulata]|uniref:Uncharacterized protein n=1 Tax=Ephemerocybe angulata TaxID=980116 RepID=A0A8H6M994_9AGAR|nr:hypothetical protein DFP72DRAFT_302798 [Tulosesus angulatus]